MKHCVLTTILLLLATLASAQETRRLWSDGPLKWTDFQSVVSPDGNSSMLHYQLGYEPAEFRDENGIKGQCYRAVAWMEAGKSWVDANCRTALNLRYNQVIFDLLEVERRQMAQSLATCSAAACLNAVLASANANLGNSIRSLRAATADGTDSNALIVWEHSVRQRLDTTPDGTTPRLHLQPLSLAFLFGMAFHMPGGNVADLFSAGAGMHVGIETGWNQHIFTSEAVIISSNLQEHMYFQDDNGVHQLTPGAPASFGSGMLTYGYRIVETPRQCLTPMVGWSWGSHTLVDGDARGMLKTNGPVLGVGYRHHFWQRYRLPGSPWAILGPNSSELSRWSIDARIFLSHSKYEFSNTTLSVWSLQASLGLAWGGRATR